MIYTLRTDRFALSLILHVFENDVPYPSNTIMDVAVESDGFSGKASMDIDVKAFAKFTAALSDIYHCLKGEAEIVEPYADRMYIRFQGDGRGHIKVSGRLQNMGQVLEFENVFDQTYLKEFSCELKTAYEKYMMKCF